MIVYLLTGIPRIVLFILLIQPELIYSSLAFYPILYDYCLEFLEWEYYFLNDPIMEEYLLEHGDDEYCRNYYQQRNEAITRQTQPVD
jgi:hypothetical protein